MGGSLVLVDSGMALLGRDPVFAGIVIVILAGLLLGSFLIPRRDEPSAYLRAVPDLEDPDPCAFCEKRVILDCDPELITGFPVAIPFPEIYHSCGSNCERKTVWIDRNRTAIRMGVA